MEIVNFFTFAGKSSKDFNIIISGEETFDAPKRDVTKVSVPGRNGDLTLDNGRFLNMEHKYPAFIRGDFVKNMSALRDWAKSLRGYQRLEDSYHPDQYMMAILIDSFLPTPTPDNIAGEIQIVFNRKPQRWLKSGEDFMPTITAATTIFNPTTFDALPLIRVVGTGTFYIGSIPVEVVTNPTYIDIDCDLQDCYNGLNNLNANVQFVNGFPKLTPGSNSVTLGTVTSLQIKPRWWTV